MPQSMYLLAREAWIGWQRFVESGPPVMNEGGTQKAEEIPPQGILLPLISSFFLESHRLFAVRKLMICFSAAMAARWPLPARAPYNDKCAHLPLPLPRQPPGGRCWRPPRAKLGARSAEGESLVGLHHGRGPRQAHGERVGCAGGLPAAAAHPASALLGFLGPLEPLLFLSPARGQCQGLGAAHLFLVQPREQACSVIAFHLAPLLPMGGARAASAGSRVRCCSFASQALRLPALLVPEAAGEGWVAAGAHASKGCLLLLPVACRQHYLSLKLGLAAKG